MHSEMCTFKCTRYVCRCKRYQLTKMSYRHSMLVLEKLPLLISIKYNACHHHGIMPLCKLYLLATQNYVNVLGMKRNCEAMVNKAFLCQSSSFPLTPSSCNDFPIHLPLVGLPLYPRYKNDKLLR